MGRGPKSSAGALRRPYEHMTETDTHREGCVRMEAEIGGKATPRTADLRKPGSKDGFFSGPFKGSAALQRPWFPTSRLQNHERVTFRCCPVCSDSSQQPWDTHAAVTCSNKPQNLGTLKVGVFFLTHPKSDADHQPSDILQSEEMTSKITVSGETETEGSHGMFCFVLFFLLRTRPGNNSHHYCQILPRDPNATARQAGKWTLPTDLDSGVPPSPRSLSACPHRSSSGSSRASCCFAHAGRLPGMPSSSSACIQTSISSHSSRRVTFHQNTVEEYCRPKTHPNL